MRAIESPTSYHKMQLFSLVIAAAAVFVASATNFTGDILNGVPVIHDLNLAEVPPQRVSRYYLRAGESVTSRYKLRFRYILTMA